MTSPTGVPGGSAPGRFTWKHLAMIAGGGLALWWFCSAFTRSLRKAIDSWTPPRDVQSETSLRRSLAQHLRTTLVDCWILEEDGVKRSRTDITVADSKDPAFASERIVIELKSALRKNTELDRLMGQLVSYRQNGYSKAIVVVVGADDNMIQILQDREQAEGIADFMLLHLK